MMQCDTTLPSLEQLAAASKWTCLKDTCDKMGKSCVDNDFRQSYRKACEFDIT